MSLFKVKTQVLGHCADLFDNVQTDEEGATVSMDGFPDIQIFFVETADDEGEVAFFALFRSTIALRLPVQSEIFERVADANSDHPFCKVRVSRWDSSNGERLAISAEVAWLASTLQPAEIKLAVASIAKAAMDLEPEFEELGQATLLFDTIAEIGRS
jgi:hypothetical protein